MTLLDIILAVPLCWLTFLGWKKGVVREAATLAGVVAGIWAAVHLSQLVATLLKLSGENAILIAFFITFVGVLILVYLLGRSLERMLKTAHLSLANKLAGSLLGMAKALCVLAVVLNGIVLIDYTILCRERGMSAVEASVTAARSRLRPILMTTLTTVLGMLPMALGRGEGSEMWRSLGVTVCWGLSISTLVTLVLIPTIYCVFAVRQENRKKKAR